MEVMAARRKNRNGKNGHAVQARLNSLRGDLDALQSDMTKLANHAGDAATDGVHSAVSSALQSAQDAVGRVQEAVGRVEDWGSENIGDAREAVRSQPLAACVLSLGAGALLGAFLLR